MKTLYVLGFFISLIFFSCTDSSVIGLEVQPASESIIINDISNPFWQSSQNQREDSIRTDEPLNLLLGEITDPIFGYSKSEFITQILLTQNNISLGTNPQVDSVILCYNYSGYYGVLEDFTALEVYPLSQNIYKDSIYFSNSFLLAPSSADWVDSYHLDTEAEKQLLRIRMNNDLGQQILNLGDDNLVDNETFLQQFPGLEVLASAPNTILYLNASGEESKFIIYYHNDENQSDTLSLTFQLDGDAARVNLFNERNDINGIINLEDIYIQSMSGYKSKIKINYKDSLKDILEGKAINKVTMSFSVLAGSETEYEAHEKLFLTRIDQDGNSISLIDYLENETIYGGVLENGEYTFNITRYFVQLLDNLAYTDELYLLSSGAPANANRTIIDKDIKLRIYYSTL